MGKAEQRRQGIKQQLHRKLVVASTLVVASQIVVASADATKARSGANTTTTCRVDRINNTTTEAIQQQTTYQSNNGGMTAGSAKDTKKVFV